MKKLIVALILTIVLTLTLATPAFAGPPEDKQGPGNMPVGAEDALSGIVTYVPGTYYHHMWISFAAIVWGNNSQGWHSLWGNIGNGLNQLRLLLGQ